MSNEVIMDNIVAQYIDFSSAGEYKEYTEYHETWRDADDY